MPLQRPQEPMFRLTELVQRLCAVARPRRDGKPAWNRWKAWRLITKLQRQNPLVRLVTQLSAGGPIYVTPTALRLCWPDMWEDLLDAEAAMPARRTA